MKFNKKYSYANTPIQYVMLFLGSEKRPETRECLGKLHEFFLQNFEKIPDKQEILNGAFGFYLEKYRDFLIRPESKYRASQDEDHQKTINT